MRTRLYSKPVFLTIIFFCLSWILLVVMRSSDSDISFSVLANHYGAGNMTPPKFGEYMSGETAAGEFTAKEDNLGIVSARIDVDHVIDADKVIFRIKEKGRGDWYYENRYRITTLPGTKYFPFGFPVIHNSRGKAFRFEIEVIRGVPGNALKIDATYPVFSAHYKFYKKTLLNDRWNFAVFLTKKAAYYFSNPGILVSSLFILLIPVLLWGIAKTYFSQWRVMHVAVFLVICLTVFETFFLVKTSETIILILTGIILVTLFYLKYDSGISFFFALAYLCMTSILYFIGDEYAIAKSGIWAYLFLIVGFIQSYWELNHRTSRDKFSPNFFDRILNKMKK